MLNGDFYEELGLQNIHIFYKTVVGVSGVARGCDGFERTPHFQIFLKNSSPLITAKIKRKLVKQCINGVYFES